MDFALAAADRRARAQGRSAATGPGFFQGSLAASRGVTPAERRAWRDGVFVCIQAMARRQGGGPQVAPAVERMCALAGVSRGACYRGWDESAPGCLETAVRDAIQRLALAHRHYGYRRITALLEREGWVVDHKRVARPMREDNLLCLHKPAFRPPTTDSWHDWRIWPNLARRLVPMVVNQLWVADITCVRLEEAFVSLASTWRCCSTPSAAGWSAGRCRSPAGRPDAGGTANGAGPSGRDPRRPGASLRPRGAACLRRLHRPARGRRHPAQHEPGRLSLRQRPSAGSCPRPFQRPDRPPAGDR